MLAGAFGLLLALALIAGMVVPILAQAPVGFPHLFWGSVTIGSAQAQAGTVITACIAGVPGNFTTVVDAQGKYGISPPFQIPAEDTSIPGRDGGVYGDIISFYVGPTLATTHPLHAFEGGDLPAGTLWDLAVGTGVTYTLTVGHTGNGTVTVSGVPGEGNFTWNAGTVVPLVATPDADYCFNTWTGGPVGNATAGNTTITMNGNYAIQANFVPKYVLNVSSGTGGSVTTPSEAISSYCPGIVVPLVATASSGYNFVNWTGGPVGNTSAASTTITMNGNYTITANFVFAGTYWLMVNTTAGGTVTQPGVGNTTQTAGAQVTLVAEPDATHCFNTWTGGPVGNATAASTTITMNGNYTIQANFVPKYVLNVSSGTGGSVTTPSVATSSYCQGIVVPLVATASSGYNFVNWTGGPVANASAASTTITMNGNYTITANFVFVGTYWLMVNTTAGGTVTQPGVGNTTQTVGAVVNLVATPSTGCFVNWTGGPVANASAASTTITMNGNYTIQANFVAKYTLTISSTSGGTVSTPGVGSFPYCPGIVVNLVATQSTGYNFVNWTGGPVASPTAASTTITMNGSYTIQANFQAVATPTPGSGPGPGPGPVTTPTPTPTRTPTPTGPTPTSTAVPTPPPIPTASPIDISGSVSGNGTVTQPIVYNVLGGQAVLNIAQGTIALTATGGPLQSISVTEVCFGYPPAPAGAKIIGCVYDYKPDGATFSPPITMTLKYDPGLLPAGFDASKLVIAFYNTATSKWEVVSGSAVDTVKNTITVQISHFTMFAVYAAAPAVTPTPTVGPTPTVVPTPTPTEEEGGLSGGVIALIVILVVIVIGLAGYWFLKKRKPPAPPAPSTPATGPTAGPKKT